MPRGGHPLRLALALLGGRIAIRRPLRPRSQHVGYCFKSWKGPPIATTAEILVYRGGVIEKNALPRNMRYTSDSVGALVECGLLTSAALPYRSAIERTARPSLSF